MQVWSQDVAKKSRKSLTTDGLVNVCSIVTRCCVMIEYDNMTMIDVFLFECSVPSAGKQEPGWLRELWWLGQVEGLGR